MSIYNIFSVHLCYHKFLDNLPKENKPRGSFSGNKKVKIQEVVDLLRIF